MADKISYTDEEYEKFISLFCKIEGKEKCIKYLAKKKLLKTIEDKQFIFDKHICDAAAYTGDLKILEFTYQQGYKFTENTYLWTVFGVGFFKNK